MSGELTSFFIRLSTVFDDSGFKKAQAGIKETKTATETLTGALGALGLTVSAGAAIWKLIDFGRESVQAFADQERANQRLQTAMRNLGVFTKAAYEENIKFAESLMRSTGFADEAVIEAQALLTTYGLYGERLRSTVISAMDLAVARHIDLNTAVSLLGKAYQGHTETLGRYGIRVKETGDNARDFQAVLDQINRSMGGSAAAATETFDGKVRKLSASFGELKESIGQQLIPTVQRYVTDLRVISDGIAEYINKRHEANRTDKSAIEVLNDQRTRLHQSKMAMEERARVMRATGQTVAADGIVESATYKAILENIRKVNAEIAEKMRLQSQDAGAPISAPTFEPPKFSDERINASMKAAEEDLALRESADKKIQSATMTSQQIEQIETEAMARNLILRGQHDKAKDLMDAMSLKREREVNQSRVAATSVMLGMLASLQGAKTKEIVIIAKAAAVAQAMMNAHLAASQALAAFAAIPPVAIAMASLMYAAGAAQAAQIAGVPLAEGGTLRAPSAGRSAIMAEAGFDETAIPLGDPRTKARLADMFLPAGVTRDDLRGAVAGGGRGGPGGAVIHVEVHQVNSFGADGAGATAEGSIDRTLEQIRVATQQGTAAALDAAKEIYETGRQLTGQS